MVYISLISLNVGPRPKANTLLFSFLFLAPLPEVWRKLQKVLARHKTIFPTGLTCNLQYVSDFPKIHRPLIPLGPLESGSGHVGFCDGQKWRRGRFSPRTSVSPANLHSICFSTIIFTITRGWHIRPGVAAVPVASQTK
jgi:hypothetical protein